MRKLTLKEFTEKAKIVHNKYYTYDNAEYTNTRTNIIITCPIHGDFQQLPNNHLRGQRCPKCFGCTKSTTKEFITKAKSIHSNKYDYSLVDYTHNRKKVEIICKEHGIFKQTPDSHLRGSGCKICSTLRPFNLYSHTDWVNAGKVSKLFKGYSVYIIECWDDNERFIKVGKTYTDILQRFRTLPYEFKVLKQHYGSGKYICELEVELQEKLKYAKYVPCKNFGGMYECFTIEHKNKILKELDSKFKQEDL